jgi:hypothetical protein
MELDTNYKKLRYEQYFIDTTLEINHTGMARFKIEYKSITYVFNGLLTHANNCVYYDEERNVIQAHFEGTKDLPDWITNILFQPKYYESFMWEDKKITLKVHKSWASMHKVLKDFVRKEVMELKELHPNATIELIGWSLGSAMAMHASQDLYYNFGITPHLFTFGSVNPIKTNIFNRRRTIKYLKSCNLSYHILGNRDDIVTYLVPRIFGFVELSRLNLNGKFNVFGLFNVAKNHFIYDKGELYSSIYKR